MEVWQKLAHYHFQVLRFPWQKKNYPSIFTILLLFTCDILEFFQEQLFVSLNTEWIFFSVN